MICSRVKRSAQGGEEHQNEAEHEAGENHRRPRNAKNSRSDEFWRATGPNTAESQERRARAPGDSRGEPGPCSWSGTPGSNRRPSPCQREQSESPTDSAPRQRSPTIEDHSGSAGPEEADAHQRSPSVHSRFVPQVFQDGARPLDVAQVAVRLGWSRDAVRAACDRGHLVHFRDHLNAYRPARPSQPP